MYDRCHKRLLDRKVVKHAKLSKGMVSIARNRV